MRVGCLEDWGSAGADEQWCGVKSKSKSWSAGEQESRARGAGEAQGGGGWSSNASADLYVRMEKSGIEFSATMLQKL